MENDEEDVMEVPRIGPTLQQHLQDYYSFRRRALALEENLLHRIAQLAEVRFVEGWRIYLRYVLMRFAGASKDQIIGCGDFLNYDITWERAEEMFRQTSESRELTEEVSDFFLLHKQLQERVTGLIQTA
jgi:hypothetical protein